MKPIIGINVDVTAGPLPEASVQSTYYDAVLKAGGIPILIPPMEPNDLDALMSRIDGLMLIGGLDYCPSSYGENERHETVEVCHPEREQFDFQLIKRALSTDFPILGICAGAQLLNISLGGTLLQDIRAEKPNTTVEHASKNGWVDGFTQHAVKLQSGTRLSKIYQSELVDVPTSHHQAVRVPGQGLVAVAWADDDIIEAVELPGARFTIGVQWHPERDFAGNRLLFQEFVNACDRDNGHH